VTTDDLRPVITYPSTQQEAWRRIEQEALAQVRTELAAEDLHPLPFGHVVAWSDCRFARTDLLSVVHRAGESIGETAVTLCGEVIPSAIRRLQLSPNLVRTLGRCRYCEDIYVKRQAAS
jgi:hypothetical protein